MASLSFDSMAEIYDETRIFNADCFDAALDYIVNRFPPRTYPELFEPGIGTGRIAFQFVRRGYRITGVDISEKMLDLLRKRVTSAGDSPLVSFRLADVTALPFADNAFDISVIVHFFHLVPGWRKAVDEVLRVLKPGAPLVLLYTGYGTEIPFLKDRYAELCRELGFTYERAGTKNAGELLGYLESHGRIHEELRDRWRWTHRMQLGTTLRYMKNRAYSFASLTPEKIHAEAMRLLEKEVIEKYPNTAGEVEVPNEIFFILSLSATSAVRK